MKRTIQEQFRIQQEKLKRASDEGNAELCLKIKDRLQFLSQLNVAERTVESNQSDIDGKPRVFVSYAGTATDLYMSAKTKLQRAGFVVRDGFQYQAREDNILKKVINSIAESTAFLGIWTEQFSTEVKGEPMVGPSTWLIEEKGMALALQKNVRLVIDEKISEYFWKRTTPERIHYRFNPATFDRYLTMAVRDIKTRYQEKLQEEMERWSQMMVKEDYVPPRKRYLEFPMSA